MPQVLLQFCFSMAEQGKTVRNLRCQELSEQHIVAIDASEAKMADAIAMMKSAKGSLVKLPRAELNLLVQLELVRDIMLAILQTGDRPSLTDVFGGDCARIARIAAICETVEFSEMNKGDQRLRLCRAACESVEKVIVDVGLGEQLRKAVAKEIAAIQGEKTRISDEYNEHIAAAQVAESEASAFEHMENFPHAALEYIVCKTELEAAIAIFRGDPGELRKLQEHLEQVERRINAAFGPILQSCGIGQVTGHTISEPATRVMGAASKCCGERRRGARKSF